MANRKYLLLGLFNNTLNQLHINSVWLWKMNWEMQSHLLSGTIPTYTCSNCVKSWNFTQGMQTPYKNSKPGSYR